MKTKLLTLFSLLALLLVSTAALADGRPTGLRISRATSGGNMNVEIDVTVPNTDNYYPGSFDTTVWLGNDMTPFYTVGVIQQYASSAHNSPLPWAIDWGDGSYFGHVRLFGPPGGPFTGTFAHTYVTPGTFIITVGDALCCSEHTTTTLDKALKGTGSVLSPTVTTGNAITGYSRYINDEFGTDYTFDNYTSPIILAVTANATVNTGTGIPTLNIYGLLAMAFVLVGAGLLVFRKPTVA